MKLIDLSQETRDALATVRYDRSIEKHEGPERWSYLIQDLLGNGLSRSFALDRLQ